MPVSAVEANSRDQVDQIEVEQVAAQNHYDLTRKNGMSVTNVKRIETHLRVSNRQSL
jgi:hypothetical protein